MDNMTIKDVVLEKKLDNYNYKDNNFVAAQEITITITLAEYRDLVTKNAVTEERIREADKNKWERENENKALKEENATLKAELYELKKSLDKLDGAKMEEQE